MLLKKWIEVYCTQEREKLFKAKNLLYENNIIYKTKTTDNNLRLSMNNIDGRGVALSRTSEVKNFYRLLVLKRTKRKLYIYYPNFNAILI